MIYLCKKTVYIYIYIYIFETGGSKWMVSLLFCHFKLKQEIFLFRIILFFIPLTRTTRKTIKSASKADSEARRPLPDPSCCCCRRRPHKHFTCGYSPNISMVCVRCECVCVCGRMCVFHLNGGSLGLHFYFIFCFQPMDQRPLYSLRHESSVSTLIIQLGT